MHYSTIERFREDKRLAEGRGHFKVTSRPTEPGVVSSGAMTSLARHTEGSIARPNLDERWRRHPNVCRCLVFRGRFSRWFISPYWFCRGFSRANGFGRGLSCVVVSEEVPWSEEWSVPGEHLRRGLGQPAVCLASSTLEPTPNTSIVIYLVVFSNQMFRSFVLQSVRCIKTVGESLLSGSSCIHPTVGLWR